MEYELGVGEFFACFSWSGVILAFFLAGGVESFGPVVDRCRFCFVEFCFLLVNASFANVFVVGCFLEGATDLRLPVLEHVDVWEDASDRCDDITFAVSPLP